MGRPRWDDLHRICHRCQHLAQSVQRKHCRQKPAAFRVHDSRRLRSMTHVEIVEAEGQGARGLSRPISPFGR